jgi:hypothetical protein
MRKKKLIVKKKLDLLCLNVWEELNLYVKNEEEEDNSEEVGFVCVMFDLLCEREIYEKMKLVVKSHVREKEGSKFQHIVTPREIEGKKVEFYFFLIRESSIV